MPVWSCALPSLEAPSPRILRVVARVWAAMRADPARAGQTLSAAMRAERSLGSKERPVAADMLLGMVRHEAALARIDPDPMRAWLRLCDDGLPDLPDPEDPREAYAIAVSLPVAIAGEWWDRRGPEAAMDLARTLTGRAPVWLRELRVGGELELAHERVSTGIGTAIRVEARGNVLASPAWRNGHVEIQDLGSQRIAEAAFPGPGGTVLDLCAGAGGKSLALAAMGARVTAWDIRSHALDELQERARRCRLEVRIAEPSGTYDVILLDAPCSGTGVLRRHPENRWKLRLYTEEQRALLARSRGRSSRIVYATCSLVREENEGISGVEGHTLWPEAGGGDGFYVATL